MGAFGFQFGFAPPAAGPVPPPPNPTAVVRVTVGAMLASAVASRTANAEIAAATPTIGVDATVNLAPSGADQTLNYDVAVPGAQVAAVAVSMPTIAVAAAAGRTATANGAVITPSVTASASASVVAGVTQPDVVSFTPSVYFNAIGPASTGAGHFWAYKVRQATAQSGEQFRVLYGDHSAAYSGPNGSRRMRNYHRDASNNALSTLTAGASEALTLDQFSCVVGYAYAHSGTWYIGQWTDGVLASTTTAVVGAQTNLQQFRRINNDENGTGSEALTFDIQGLWLSTGSAHDSATPPIAYSDFFDGSGNWVVNTNATVGGKASDLGLLHDAADWNALPGKTGTVT